MFNNDNDNNQDNFNDQNFDNNDDDEEYNNIYDEYFYVDQDKDKINIRQLSSTQLKNPDNIKLVDKLQISLNLEYDKFVHMKIKDAENKRWEVPEKEVLDKDYLLNKNDRTKEQKEENGRNNRQRDTIKWKDIPNKRNARDGKGS